jgi:hypothetical protein
MNNNDKPWSATEPAAAVNNQIVEEEQMLQQAEARTSKEVKEID